MCVNRELECVATIERLRMYCNRGSDCMCEWRIRICVKQIIRMCESRIRMCCKNRGSECIATGDRNNLNRGSECIVCVNKKVRMCVKRGSEYVATMQDRNVLQQKIGMYCACEQKNQNVCEQRIEYVCAQRIGMCMNRELECVATIERLRMYCKTASDCMY